MVNWFDQITYMLFWSIFVIIIRKIIMFIGTKILIIINEHIINEQNIYAEAVFNEMELL